LRVRYMITSSGHFGLRPLADETKLQGMSSESSDQ